MNGINYNPFPAPQCALREDQCRPSERVSLGEVALVTTVQLLENPEIQNAALRLSGYVVSKLFDTFSTMLGYGKQPFPPPILAPFDPNLVIPPPPVATVAIGQKFNPCLDQVLDDGTIAEAYFLENKKTQNDMNFDIESIGKSVFEKQDKEADETTRFSSFVTQKLKNLHPDLNLYNSVYFRGGANPVPHRDNSEKENLFTIFFELGTVNEKTGKWSGKDVLKTLILNTESGQECAQDLPSVSLPALSAGSIMVFNGRTCHMADPVHFSNNINKRIALCVRLVSPKNFNFIEALDNLGFDNLI